MDEQLSLSALGIGSMIEKGNPETADHRPVTGRPGVQAENTEQKRRTACLSYSGRFFPEFC